MDMHGPAAVKLLSYLIQLWMLRMVALGHYNVLTTSQNSLKTIAKYLLWWKCEYCILLNLSKSTLLPFITSWSNSPLSITGEVLYQLYIWAFHMSKDSHNLIPIFILSIQGSQHLSIYQGKKMNNAAILTFDHQQDLMQNAMQFKLG